LLYAQISSRQANTYWSVQSLNVVLNSELYIEEPRSGFQSHIEDDASRRTNSEQFVCSLSKQFYSYSVNSKMLYKAASLREENLLPLLSSQLEQRHLHHIFLHMHYRSYLFLIVVFSHSSSSSSQRRCRLSCSRSKSLESPHWATCLGTGLWRPTS